VGGLLAGATRLVGVEGVSTRDELIDDALHRILVWQLVDIEVADGVVGGRRAEEESFNIAAALNQGLELVDVLLQLFLLFGKLLVVIKIGCHCLI